MKKILITLVALVALTTAANAQYGNAFGVRAKIFKKLLQLNSRKINDSIKKWAKELNRHFSKERHTDG